jgi:hypothetical protein
VEEANRASPRHSRICKEMILVTSPFKLLGRTTKGTPDRTAILANYDAEIEEAYRAMESRLSEDRCYHDKAKGA